MPNPCPLITRVESALSTAGTATGAPPVNTTSQQSNTTFARDLTINIGAGVQAKGTMSALKEGNLQEFPFDVNINQNSLLCPEIDTTLVLNMVFSYNAMLVKLDGDTGVGDTDYEATLKATAGSLGQLIDKLNALYAKLDDDTGVGDTDYASSLGLAVGATDAETKTSYNALLVKLDGDTGVTDTDYEALHAVA